MKKLLAIVAILLAPTMALADFKIIVPFAPGGAVDTVARTFAIHVEKTTGKNVIVENITGAGSVVASRRLLESSGNVAMVNSSSHYANIVQNTFAEDAFTITSVLAESPLMIGTPASKKYTCQSMKAAPGPIFIGTNGKDSITYAPAKILFDNEPKKYIDIPYKGASQATIDLIAGRIDMIFFATMHDNPEITMLANTGSTVFEGLPTTKDCLGVTQNVVNQFLLATNKKADPEFVKMLNDLGMKFNKDPANASFFKSKGIRPVASTLEGTKKQFDDQVKIWQKSYK